MKRCPTCNTALGVLITAVVIGLFATVHQKHFCPMWVSAATFSATGFLYMSFSAWFLKQARRERQDMLIDEVTLGLMGQYGGAVPLNGTYKDIKGRVWERKS